MSTPQRIGNFIRMYKGSRELKEKRFQNAAPARLLNNVPDRYTDGYKYLSFIYQGAARTRTGDNIESQLILANTRNNTSVEANKLSMNHAIEAVRGNYGVVMYTCLMNADWSVNRVLATETWLCTSLSYDETTIELQLSSAIDAVGADAPTRVLTKDLVGSLPLTGQIINS